jgi:phospholipid/cholesterol/gamma-HCH transport system permease protein
MTAARAASLDARPTSSGGLAIALAGDWLLGQPLPDTSPVLARLQAKPKPTALEFDTHDLGQWNTGLLTLLVAICRAASAGQINVSLEGLPAGARDLLKLAFAVKKRDETHRARREPGLVEQAGIATLQTWDATRKITAFLGEFILSLVRLVRGKATYQRSDIWLALESAGAEAVPIVSLISFLIGMIFAFVGVRQLEMFGAGIYVADLVAVAMVREIAAIMTAIVMAGRTGAAYAATLGTMKVNEEIDALDTLGIRPMDFLVLPRVLSLIVMMPLLTLYASLMGILGGLTVAMTMLDVTFVQYLAQTRDALGLNSLFGGLFKALVYGCLVGLAGCEQGMACGNSALAVGESTTRAVVASIVLIIVSASILTVIYINLGI